MTALVGQQSAAVDQPQLSAVLTSGMGASQPTVTQAAGRVTLAFAVLAGRPGSDHRPGLPR